MFKKKLLGLRRVLSNLGLRGRAAKLIRGTRAKDGAAFSKGIPEQLYPVSRGIDYYKNFFEEDFVLLLQGFLAKKQKARVLDISAGFGGFLQGLKREFGNRVETVATGLKRPPSVAGIDSYRVMHSAKLWKPRPLEGKFDLIVSAAGGTQFLGKRKIVQRVLSLLSPEGRAFLDLGSLLTGPGGKVKTMENDLKKFFERNGFAVKKTLHRKTMEGPVITIMEISRKE